MLHGVQLTVNTQRGQTIIVTTCPGKEGLWALITLLTGGVRFGAAWLESTTCTVYIEYSGGGGVICKVSFVNFNICDAGCQLGKYY